MLTQVDTVIGFAVVMSIVSLFIMIATQMCSAFLGLRGLNLAYALETMMHRLQPQVSPEGCRNVIDEVLTHPAISDTVLSLRKEEPRIARFFPFVAWLRHRWSRATAVRPDELAEIMREIAAGPIATLLGLLPDLLAAVDSALAESALSGAAAAVVQDLQVARKDISDAIAALSSVTSASGRSARQPLAELPSALQQGINGFVNILPTLSSLGVAMPSGLPGNTSDRAGPLRALTLQFAAAWDKLGAWKKQAMAIGSAMAVRQLNAVLAEAATDGTKFEKWFNSAQNRAEQWFALHTRVITVIGAVAAALILQLDTVELVKTLSRNSDLRSKLVARADTLVQREKEIARGPDSSQVRQRALATLGQEHPHWLLTPPAGHSEDDPATWLSAQADAGRDVVIEAYRQDVRRVLLGVDAQSLSQVEADSNAASLALMPDPYPAQLWPRPLVLHRDLPNHTTIYWSWPLHHLFGILLTAALLSLGGPFWFNLLKQLSDLRPALANAVDASPKQGVAPSS